MPNPRHSRNSRTRTRTSVALLALATAAVWTGPAAAGPPADASGTILPTSRTVTDVREADGNVFETRIVTRAISGTFLGTIVSNVEAVIHPTGESNFHGFETCTCTVEGRAGMVVFRFQGRTVDGVPHARLVAVSASGGLNGLHAVLEVEGRVYSGRYHFEE